VIAERLPGPREPLTFHNMGAYGGWNDYWLSDDCPFDFFIVQAWVTPKKETQAHGMSGESTWGQWLKRAREQGKRVVAVVTPVGWKEAKDPLAYFKAGIDLFMQQVDENLLYAVTLDEENIYWNNHAELLRKLYRYTKENYNVPVYQWWSPYAGPPGFGWPNLPADGWLIDEYAHGDVSFEYFIRSYVVHQLPVIQIVWAAPLMTAFNWEKAGDPAFDWQLRVARKYDIPSSFFLWEGHGNIWGWNPKALPASKDVYERAVEWTRRAAGSRLEPYRATWDDMPSLQPCLLICSKSGTMSFEEDFLNSGGLVAKGAAIKGFRDLRWDGGPLELRPRHPGAATATLLYPLRCEFPAKRLYVAVSGQIVPALAGRVEVSASPNGKDWIPAVVMSARGTVTLDLSGYKRFRMTRNVWVRIVLSGGAQTVGDVPAAIEAIKVSGQFVPPTTKEIRLQVVPGIPVRWATDFSGGSTLFTADVDNQNEFELGSGFIGTHGVSGYVNKVVSGYVNKVTVRQKFVADNDIALQRIVSTNYADQQNSGATNSLGISLDGNNVLAEQSTSGKANGAQLILDLTQDQRLRSVREFWVHLTMNCSCGVKTGTTNRITKLIVEGVGAKSEPKSG